MSEYFGTLTQRPVHPASPVLLLLLPESTSTKHFLLWPTSLTEPWVAALISVTGLHRGIVRPLSLVFLGACCIYTTRLNPHLSARYRGQSIHTVSHRDCPVYTRLEIPRTRLCCRSSTNTAVTVVECGPVACNRAYLCIFGSQQFKSRLGGHCVYRSPNTVHAPLFGKLNAFTKNGPLRTSIPCLGSIK
jgi:hypothetical protein